MQKIFLFSVWGSVKREKKGGNGSGTDVISVADMIYRGFAALRDAGRFTRRLPKGDLRFTPSYRDYGPSALRWLNVKHRAKGPIYR
jgi:hypothetical protein